MVAKTDNYIPKSYEKIDFWTGEGTGVWQRHCPWCGFLGHNSFVRSLPHSTWHRIKAILGRCQYCNDPFCND